MMKIRSLSKTAFQIVVTVLFVGTVTGLASADARVEIAAKYCGSSDAKGYMEKRVDELRRSGDSALNTLRHMAADSDYAYQGCGIALLERLEDKKSLPLFRRLAKDRTQKMNIRLLAIESLWSLDDVTAIPELADLLKSPDHEVRDAAINALARIDDPSALQVLEDEADRPHDPAYIGLLVVAIGRHEDPRSLDVIRAITGRQSDIRASFAIASALLHTKESIAFSDKMLSGITESRWRIMAIQQIIDELKRLRARNTEDYNRFMQLNATIEHYQQLLPVDKRVRD